ncbi:MAG: hypothetical protein II486_09085 [Thermoguttaceae bacterium]|nr:hypothetical protein [Thermoguttaceae bacterium]
MKRLITGEARPELLAIEQHAKGISDGSTSDCKFVTDPEVLISRLSFSHIREIMKLEDPFERFFYPAVYPAIYPAILWRDISLVS